MTEGPFDALEIPTCTCGNVDDWHDIDCAMAPIIARRMDEAEHARQSRIGGE